MSRIVGAANLMKTKAAGFHRRDEQSRRGSRFPRPKEKNFLSTQLCRDCRLFTGQSVDPAWPQSIPLELCWLVREIGINAL